MAINEPSMFRSTDSWYPDAFARETESALTKALQQSFFDTHHPIQSHSQLNHPLISSSFFVNQTHDYTPSVSTVTGSVSGSGSDPETPGSKRSLGVSIAKTTTTKRKSRASKRSMTTFIQADPANFRQMVQEVTGAKFEGNGRLPVVKPEPLRQPFVNKLQGLMLPTLDTSAYLLDVPNTNNNTRRFPPMSQTTENNGVAGVAVGDFYSFSSFPTLESSI
ncbi:hypothetical protein QVD17_00336 [Tagetes erecta]|uniref:VQ domain-containing protein n=1 Tax=Tagetes erecta TaxID=13708 RepID=A0AAD8L5L3_TARER|nr:hypothetical protein QVD17_00336 [Tagetes erecta]